MRTSFKTIGSSALIGALLILPLMTMEIVNRRSYGEDFPLMLFFGLWLNTFVICLVLMPVVVGWRAGRNAEADSVPAQGYTLITNPKSSAIISVILIVSPFILIWLDSLGWVDMQTLVNGPDPQVFYLPGLFINLGILSIMAAGGIIAAVPVARTLRAGGSLLAHPVNLVIVVLFVAAIGYGLGSLIIDQWPCFIGVPRCD